MLASLVPLGCGSDDPKIDRRGGDIPDADGMGGESSMAAGGANSGTSIAFCEALGVIRGKCQRCHGDPLENSAPVPFLTYEDTQVPYFDSDKKYSDIMLSVVERDVMPYISLNQGPTPIMPPVQSLTAEEKATLLGWLKQGALPIGGTDCP